MLLSILLGIIRIILFTGVFLYFLGGFIGVILELIEKTHKLTKAKAPIKMVLKTFLKYLVISFALFIAAAYTGFIVYFLFTNPDVLFEAPSCNKVLDSYRELP